MPVVIVGSARSGTSMVARMLNVCGLYLGQSVEMPDGDRANPGGSWEHFGFLPINVRILKHLAGPIENIRPLAPNWEFDPGLDSLYDEAGQMIARSFANRDDWGWKQPACALTIPFWRRLLPGLKIIDCVRHPLDCAASISSSHDIQREYALVLWQYYHLTALTDTVPNERILTLYEGYFPDFRPALNPLLDFVGLPRPAPGSETESRIREFHKPALKHHSSAIEILLADSTVSKLVKDLYCQLVSSPPDGSEIPILSQAPEYLPLLRQAARVIALGTDVTTAIEKYDRVLLHRDELVVECAELNRRHAEEIRSLNVRIGELNESEARRQELEQILNSRTHRLATAICKLRLRFAGRAGRVPHRDSRVGDDPQAT